MTGGTITLESLLSFARTLSGECGLEPPGDAEAAVAVILSSIASHALDGTGHVPEPEHSTVEKCSVASCFLTACSVPLISRVREEGHEIEAPSLMHRTGTLVFKAFGDEDREAIVDSGIMLFREMVHEARGSRRMEEWLGSVHSVTQRYILTRGTSDCALLIAPLYLVLLMAARQAGA